MNKYCEVSNSFVYLMFNFHLLAIAQHYAWKSSLGFLARKILAVTFRWQAFGAGFKDSKFKIFPHDDLFLKIEKLLSRTDALPAVIGIHFIQLVLCRVVVVMMNDR